MKSLKNFAGVRGVRPDEVIPDKPILMVIFAPPGLGKTSLSFTADNPLHFDFDKGIHRARQENRPFYFEIDDYQGFRQMVYSPDFKKGIQDENYKSVVVDTVGTMLDNYMAKWLMKQNSKNARGTVLSLQGWGALKVEFNQIKEQLVKNVGVDIIAIAHDKTNDEGTTALAISGGSKDVIYQTADIIAYIEKNGSDRVISFEPQQGRIGKNPGFPKMVIPNFETSPEKYDNFLKNLIAQARQIMRTQTKAQREAIEKVKEYKQQINAVDNFKDLEALILDYCKMSPSYVSQLHQTAEKVYVGIYSDCYWSGYEEAVDFNKAIPDINKFVKNSVFEPFINAVKKGLILLAKEKGLVFNREEACFEPEKKTEKKTDKKEERAND